MEKLIWVNFFHWLLFPQRKPLMTKEMQAAPITWLANQFGLNYHWEWNSNERYIGWCWDNREQWGKLCHWPWEKKTVSEKTNLARYTLGTIQLLQVRLSCLAVKILSIARGYIQLDLYFKRLRKMIVLSWHAGNFCWIERLLMENKNWWNTVFSQLFCERK